MVTPVLLQCRTEELPVLQGKNPHFFHGLNLKDVCRPRLVKVLEHTQVHQYALQKKLTEV